LNETKFHLVIVYNAAENTYSLSEHNQPPDKAKQLVEEFNQHMKPGFTLITIEQRKVQKSGNRAAVLGIAAASEIR